MYKIENYGMFILIITLFICSCSKDCTGPSNKKPNSPFNPNPPDNSINISINTTLNWSCSDPEDDPLTYDVYFGTDITPDSTELVSTGQSSTSYDPGTLNYETIYYWKIVVKDDHNNSTAGNVWSFTTITSGGGDFEWCDVLAGEYTYGPGDDTLTIDYDYQIMKNEVTNAQYVTYLEEAYAAGDIWIEDSNVVGYYDGDENYPAGNYDFYHLGTPSGSNNYARISWDGSSFIINVPSGYEPGDFDDHPVVYVTWFGAWAFAEHYGYRLPTEHEWEKSARGITGWNYPWGDDIDGSRANYWWSGDPWDNGTTPIGFYNGQNYQGFQTTDSTSPYDAYDMAGNVWDWTDSFWSEIFSSRVTRGGGYHSYTDRLRSWYRLDYWPIYGSNDIGFRCAVSD